MTAEVAVMNKLAVALAADSAVTISYQSGRKIYNSANKLFKLSSQHPIGIMFYGAAEFMGMPWETIIKAYRMKLGDQKFSVLEEYSENFIAFLREKDERLFPEKEQIEFYRITVVSYFDFILNQILDQVNAEITNQGELPENEVEKIIETVIEKHHAEWEDSETLLGVDKKYIGDVKKLSETFFEEVKNEVFQEIPLSDKSIKRLSQICVFLATKSKFSNDIAGIVFAGFGEDNFFPSVISFEVEGLIHRRLKYKSGRDVKIDFENTVSIVPFAQSEMVATFMEGIDPYYRATMLKYLTDLFDEYPKIILDAIPQLSEEEKSSLLEKLKTIGGGNWLKNFDTIMRDYQIQRHVNPIISNVSNLPIEELAAMAESLVNITSFKRRVSTEAETVGGPIDVAVISKKDGYIWIRRKHYFKPELNQHFLANYYRGWTGKEELDDD